MASKSSDKTIKAVAPRPAWTLQRLRKLLAATKAAAPLQDGKPQTWPGICEAIEEATGVAVPHERLRQFVEGVTDAAGVLRFPAPRPERIEAVIRWATDPADPLISRVELEQEFYQMRAPLCLADLLSSSGASLPPKDKLIGSFQGMRMLDEAVELFTLTFQDFEAPGIWHVVEEHSRQKGAPEGSMNGHAIVASEGWSVVSEEDQLLLFMREPRQALNHRWILLSDADLWSDEPIDELVFLRQSYPYDSAAAGSPLEAKVADDVIRFRRS